MELTAQSVARLHRALGNPMRLRVAHLIVLQPLSVMDVQTILALPQAVTSKHLACLHRAGLIERSRSGNRVFYALPKDTPPEIALLIGHLKQCATHIESLRRDAEILGRTVARTSAVEAALESNRSRRKKNYIPQVESNSPQPPAWPGSGEFID